MNSAKSILMVGGKSVVGYSESDSVVSVGKAYRLRYVYRMLKGRITRSVVMCVENYHEQLMFYV